MEESARVPLFCLFGVRAGDLNALRKDAIPLQGRCKFDANSYYTRGIEELAFGIQSEFKKREKFEEI